MPKHFKPAQTRVMVVTPATGASKNGMSVTSDRRRTVPAAGDKPSYTLTFRPGVPLLISGREIDACKKDLDSGGLVPCEIGDEHLKQIMADFADAERDKQISELRDAVGRLTGALQQTGLYDQAEIDAVLTGRKLQAT